MMKRKIFKTLETIKRKCVLSLMLAGFAMINTGFTDNVEFPKIQPIEVEEVEEVEETSAEPTAIAVGENGQIKISEDNELTRALAQAIEDSLGKGAAQFVVVANFNLSVFANCNRCRFCARLFN